MLLVAANGTAGWDPDWVHNLRAEPQATATVDGVEQRVVADVLDDDLRGRFLGTVRASIPGFGAAEAACSRTIPIIRLRPIG